MNNLMIDLETLDTRSSAVIVSIGAVVFDRKSILRTGYWILDLEEQIKRGRTISSQTMAWWMKQSEDARKVFTDQSSYRNSILEFHGQFSSLFNGEELAVWGNGSDFDTAIMIDFYNRHSLVPPSGWKYYNNLCFRSFNKWFDAKRMVKREGVHHNALDDAVYQAECVLKVWNKQ